MSEVDTDLADPPALEDDQAAGDALDEVLRKIDAELLQEVELGESVRAQIEEARGDTRRNARVYWGGMIIILLLLMVVFLASRSGDDTRIKEAVTAALAESPRGGAEDDTPPSRVMAATGGVLPTVRFLGSSALPQNPAIFRSLVCLKAYKIELDLADCKDWRASGVSVVDWKLDEWFDGAERTEQWVMRLAREEGADLSIPFDADCGVGECGPGGFDAVVSINGTSAEGKWRIRAHTPGAPDTLNWLVVTPEESDFKSGVMALEVVIKRRNVEGVPFSVAAHDASVFKNAPPYSWTLHFLKDPRTVSVIPYDQARKVLLCDPRRLLPSHRPFSRAVDGIGVPNALDYNPLFDNAHVTYHDEMASIDCPVTAVAFDQVTWNESNAAREKDNYLSRTNERLLRISGEQRRRPVDVFASCDQCDRQEAITETLRRLGDSDKARIRYLVSPDGVSNCPDMLKELPTTGAFQCRIASQDLPGRMFGVYDPDQPEKSVIAWTVIPDTNFTASFSGETATAYQKALFDAAWDASSTPCSAH